MKKAAFNPQGYIPSVTSVTKRDKRDKSHLGNRRDSVTTPPVGGLSCHACPGGVQKAPRELIDILAIATAGERLARDYQLLRSEVLKYLDGYTSRGMRAEGRALARLRKAAERNDFGAPCPGSPGSPERKAEQRIRNERATRMADTLARKKAAKP